MRYLPIECLTKLENMFVRHLDIFFLGTPIHDNHISQSIFDAAMKHMIRNIQSIETKLLKIDWGKILTFNENHTMLSSKLNIDQRIQTYKLDELKQFEKKFNLLYCESILYFEKYLWRFLILIQNLFSTKNQSISKVFKIILISHNFLEIIILFLYDNFCWLSVMLVAILSEKNGNILWDNPIKCFFKINKKFKSIHKSFIWWGFTFSLNQV